MDLEPSSKAELQNQARVHPLWQELILIERICSEECLPVAAGEVNAILRINSDMEEMTSGTLNIFVSYFSTSL